ncbi:MAG: CPBP family intramembrane metalloprotease, partial [Anaerolineae bacterium]|nr:CPBP family intramembrane metalloprotease [Anaerolineae bacterium]
YAYFVAAAASAASPLCGPWLARLFKAPANTLRGIALAKLSDSVVTVGVIFFLVFLIGIRPGEVFLQWGNLTVGLVVGLSAFAVFASLAYRQYATFGLGDGVLRSLLPWILVFVFSNAFMEELWMRGIFLGLLDALMGPWGALVATSLVFTAAHLGVTYMTGAEKLRFLFILLPLALAWGFLMQWTGSLLGSTLFHAGGDLLIINGFVGALYGKPAEQTAQPSPA